MLHWEDKTQEYPPLNSGLAENKEWRTLASALYHQCKHKGVSSLYRRLLPWILEPAGPQTMSQDKFQLPLAFSEFFTEEILKMIGALTNKPYQWDLINFKEFFVVVVKSS